VSALVAALVPRVPAALGAPESVGVALLTTQALPKHGFQCVM
jgi:hypothetical protein